MNESTLTQLKIIVERAVRPVPAGIDRKRTMREELLTHVMAVFEEEAKLGDDNAALERTARRFGAPDELTRQLQATVRPRDRLVGFIEALIGFPPRESKLRLASRHALLVAALVTPLLGLMMVIIGHWGEWLTLKRLPAILAPVYLTVLTFCASLIVQGMTQALFGLGGRSWPGVLAFGLAAWLLVPAVTLLWCFAFSGELMSSLFEVLPLLLPALLAPALLVFVVRLCITEIRYCEEWASLPLQQDS